MESEMVECHFLAEAKPANDMRDKGNDLYTRSTDLVNVRDFGAGLHCGSQQCLRRSSLYVSTTRNGIVSSV